MIGAGLRPGPIRGQGTYRHTQLHRSPSFAGVPRAEVLIHSTSSAVSVKYRTSSSRPASTGHDSSRRISAAEKNCAATPSLRTPRTLTGDIIPSQPPDPTPDPHHHSSDPKTLNTAETTGTPAQHTDFVAQYQGFEILGR